MAKGQKRLVITGSLVCSLFLNVAGLITLSLPATASAQTPEFLWARNIGGPDYEYDDRVAIDRAGNCLVTGTFQGSTLRLGSFVLTNASGCNVFLAKFDPAGNVLWANQLGSHPYAVCNMSLGLAVDSASNTYVLAVGL